VVRLVDHDLKGGAPPIHADLREVVLADGPAQIIEAEDLLAIGLNDDVARSEVRLGRGRGRVDLLDDDPPGEPIRELQIEAILRRQLAGAEALQGGLRPGGRQRCLGRLRRPLLGGVLTTGVGLGLGAPLGPPSRGMPDGGLGGETRGAGLVRAGSSPA
jgi:hypothetical protein